MAWTPAPFNLVEEGDPFTYSQHTAISSISGTEAFQIEVKARDKRGCIVCGESDRCLLRLTYIIPKVEEDTWQMMKEHGYVPNSARSAERETRNGVMLCSPHHKLFDAFRYYIRWVPEASLEKYHGRAIDLHVGDHHLPFHGAFLFHEMRVRGFLPVTGDRDIVTPIPWVDWIDAQAPDQGGGGGGEGSGVHGRDGHGQGNNNDGIVTGGGHHLRSHGPVHDSSQTFTPTNLFLEPAALQAMKDSFAQQANWKASMMEGETWEGSADENAEKWRRIMGN